MAELSYFFIINNIWSLRPYTAKNKTNIWFNVLANIVCVTQAQHSLSPSKELHYQKQLKSHKTAIPQHWVIFYFIWKDKRTCLTCWTMAHKQLLIQYAVVCTENLKCTSLEIHNCLSHCTYLFGHFLIAGCFVPDLVHSQGKVSSSSRERTLTFATLPCNHLTYLALLADILPDIHPACVMKYVLSVTSRFSGTETPGEDRLTIFHLAAGQQSNCQCLEI